MSDVAIVVLAAGRATRFGAGAHDSKVLADLDGRPLVAHVVATALAAAPSEVIVVTGHAGDAVARAIAHLPVRRVHNARAASGLAGSLRAAIAALAGTPDAVVVMLADMPRVETTTVVALVAAFEAGNADAVVPIHAGRQGNPVLLARSLFPAVETLDGDQGARRLLEAESIRVVRVSVDDPGTLVDVDTPEALRALAGSKVRPPNDRPR